MNFNTQMFHQYPELSALACVLVAAAVISYGSRQLGQLALSDLTVGPKELLKGAMVCSALYALLFMAVAALALMAATSLPVALPVAAMAATVSFINALAPAFAMQQNGGAEVAKRKEHGRKMAARCLKLFARIDRRGKGLLNEDDLNAAIARGDMTGADKEALRYVRDHAANIGSVVERSVTSHHVVPGALMSGYSTVVQQTTKHYGVSADDLHNYPAKLERLYQLWN